MKRHHFLPAEVQPELDFSTSVPAATKPLSTRDCVRAALAFLSSLAPAGVASQVSTRRCTFKVSAAAFWWGKERKTIEKTAIVVAGCDAGECFAAGGFSPERIERIRELEARRDELEALIREREPGLAASDDLFDEFRTWNYAGSTNPEYHSVANALDAELRALRRGSRLELYRRAGVADYCYLALPEAQLAAGAPLPEWGAVAITPQGGFRLVREAPEQPEILPMARRRLAENIAAAARDAVWFAAGLESASGGRIVYRQRPRKRRKILRIPE